MVRPRLRIVLGFAMLVAAAGCQRLPAGSTASASSASAGGSATGGTTTGFGTSVGTFIGSTSGSGGDGGPSFACDPVTQIGCATGQKCTAVTSGGAYSYKCVEDSPSLDPFDACEAAPQTGVDGCPAGFVCLADDSDAALCVGHCKTSSDCDKGLCEPNPVDDIPYCAVECSPFDNACPAPLQCRRSDDRFTCRFPSEGDTGTAGAACSGSDDGGCAAGFVCLTGELVPGCNEDHCCTNVCDLGNGGACSSPATCSALFDAPAPGFEQVGACFVPA